MTSPTKPILKFILGSRGIIAVFSSYIHIGDIYNGQFSAKCTVFLDELKAIVEYIEKNDPN